MLITRNGVSIRLRSAQGLDGVFFHHCVSGARFLSEATRVPSIFIEMAERITPRR